MSNLLGSLLIKLGLDLTEFRSGLTASEKELKKATTAIRRAGREMQEIGQQMAVMISAPLLAAGYGIVRTAGNFESAMTKIEIATKASSAEMKAMNDLALQIGKDTIFGASQAASAMELLAKAGIDTTTIINGAAKAVTTLAAAAGSELDPAAAAISDTLGQFKLSTADLPKIVNQITGAVNQSKFDFKDFQLAMAQSGGIAASTGMSFEEFAATIAGVSFQIGSGSDAGTALKTFLLSLTPTTKEAAAAMREYGLTFFDASGQMLNIADIAEQLQVKFGQLSEKDRTEAFKKMFGTDAFRIAVGLMNQGGEGIDKLRAKLGATNAEEQAAKRMEGFNGQLEQLKGSLETLAIRIGQSGVLEAVTGLIEGITGLIDTLAELSPMTLKIVSGLAVFVAALAPLIIAFGTLKIAAAPFLAQLGLMGGATGAATAGVSGVTGALIAAGTAVKAFTIAAAPWIAVIAAVAAGSYALSQAFSDSAQRARQAEDAAATFGSTVQAGTEFMQGLRGVTESATQASGTLGGSLGVTTSELRKAWNAADQLIAKLYGVEAAAYRTAKALAINNAVDAHRRVQVFETMRAGASDTNAKFAPIHQRQYDKARQDLTAAGKDLILLDKDLQRRMKDYASGTGGAATGATTSVAGLNRELEKTGGTAERSGGRARAAVESFADKLNKLKGELFPDAAITNTLNESLKLVATAEQKGMMDFASATAARAQIMSNAFKALHGDIEALFERLTPGAREMKDFQASLRTLEAGIKAGGVAGLTAEQLSGARGRLLQAANDDQIVNAGASLEETMDLLDKGWFATDRMQGGLNDLQAAITETAQKTEAQNVRIVKSFKDTADQTLAAIDRMVRAVQGGGFMDILGAVIGLGIQLGSIGVFGKGVADRINAPEKTKAYADGTNWHPGGWALVGERGPEVVKMPRGSSVVSNHQLGNLGLGSQRVEIVDTTGLFRFRVDGQIAEAAPGIASAGAQAGQRRAAWSQSRQVA